jgi:hypothetical protein
MKIVSLTILALLIASPSVAEPPRWTMKNGLTIALHPQAIDQKGTGGPRGLIRIGLPLNPDETAPGLLNFIAIEPVTFDLRRGLSELEKSPVDGKPGLIFRSESEQTKEGLRITIRTEKFENGAHPYVVVELKADHPNEVAFKVFAERDSVPMLKCVLTATMGNMQRLRRLHLRKGIATPAALFPRDPGDQFTHRIDFSLKDLVRDERGVIVAADSDEPDARALSKTLPDALRFWAYKGVNFQQYWRQPDPVDEDLVASVNGRKTYWKRQTELPGGPAFENFELQAQFYPGQTFIFGVKPPDNSR